MNTKRILRFAARVAYDAIRPLKPTKAKMIFLAVVMISAANSYAIYDCTHETSPVPTVVYIGGGLQLAALEIGFVLVLYYLFNTVLAEIVRDLIRYLKREWRNTDDTPLD